MRVQQPSAAGDADPDYNCVGYTVGEYKTPPGKKWWDDEDGHVPGHYVVDIVYGDGHAPLTNAEIDSFFLTENGCGLRPTATGPADATVMYYGIHYKQDGTYDYGFHAALRRGGWDADGAGNWIMYESKLGSWERIEHVSNQLNDAVYGSPTRYYK